MIWKLRYRSDNVDCILGVAMAYYRVEEVYNVACRCEVDALRRWGSRNFRAIAGSSVIGAE